MDNWGDYEKLDKDFSTTKREVVVDKQKASIKKEEVEMKENVKAQVNIKVTIQGQMALQSNDGFYYSVDKSGRMKREYVVFENIAEPILRDSVALEVGDICLYKDEFCFCSAAEDNYYQLTSFSTKEISQVHRGTELDALQTPYRVLHNPLDIILQADENLNPLTLLANNPANAEKINLSMQIEQTEAISELLNHLKS